MKLRHLLALGAGAAALAGCLEIPPTEPVCRPITPQQSAIRGDTVVLASGLRFLPGAPGTGAPVESCREVRLRFDLLVGDSVVESSGDTTIAFVPGERAVVRGLEEGVIGMRPGGTRRLIVPPVLGYGAQAREAPGRGVVIPANSTLVIDVEVVTVGGGQ